MGWGIGRIALVGGDRMYSPLEEVNRCTSDSQGEQEFRMIQAWFWMTGAAYDFETGYRQMIEMLAKRSDMTAVIAVNDFHGRMGP